MFTVCREYLISKLSQSGLRTKPITSMKKLSQSYETHIGAVLFEEEAYERGDAKRKYIDQTGGQHKRLKLFSRETTFAVIIGDPEPEKAESMFETLIQNLDKGIFINGNYTAIEVGNAEWVDDEDSIIKSKVAVKVRITFIGGIYKDIDLIRVENIDLTIESNRKEI